MDTPDFRSQIVAYIRTQAQPPDKYAHQPRLYQLAVRLGQGQPFDDDVLFAAVWLHDLGVFVGHRPSDLTALATWDHLAYAVEKVPDLLKQWGFPAEKIPAVINAILTHLPAGQPTSIEGSLLHDADILEQLGAVGILRMVSKVGRDSRYPTHAAAIAMLEQQVQTLPSHLRLSQAKIMAKPRIDLLDSFLRAAQQESQGVLSGNDWIPYG
ncbi:MAG: HD domain-containing protein [Cyanobacteriota bacterium]|nr:HD domain-containing protein [Cyanobacteriota bacterium]